MTTSQEILVLGGSGVDTIVRVDELTVPAGDSLAVPAIRDYVAHAGTGVALGFHALGRTTAFLDLVGEDEQGELIRARYRAAGLDFACLTAPAGTPRSVNLVDRQGRRFSFFDGRHPEDARLPAGFCRPRLVRAAHVHVSGQGICRDLLGEIQQSAATLSTDVHAWDGHAAWAEGYAYGSDLVFMSAATVGEGAPAVLRRILTEGRARVAVATDGAKGCWVATRERPEAVHRPALTPPGPVVDSNGAGDAFVTAFLDVWLRGGGVEEAVRAGSASGAFACTQSGTHERLITRAELDQALAALR